MTDSAVMNMGFAAVVMGLGAYYLHGRMEAADVQMPGQTPVAVAAAEPPKPAMQHSASVVSVPRTNGQFYTQARVNSGSVRFLVDTGASTIALTLDDARRAGIDPRSLEYSVPVDTANGRTYAAHVYLKDVQVGGIRVRNVEGLVMREGLHISLLGMSFLGQLQKVEATPTQLLMRL